jgi:CubicO group peptidase (beta-lactamase class C family)
MKKLIFFILTANISFGQVFQQKLDSLLASNYSQNQAGIAVLVLYKGQEIYKKGFGLANLETKKPITEHTNFRMASVSKQFTAMCIMLLEKQKKLSYEDNLLKFFPDFDKTVGSQIKVKHLLTHTSGILDYEELIPSNQKEQLLDADVVGFLQNQSKTYFAAGSKFQYSNSGFCMLEQIIERVSNMSFVQFIETQVFKPLGMNNTRMYVAGQNIPNRAMGYARNDKGELIFSDQSITSATKGDGCIYTSIEDYKKWHNALINNKLIDLKSELSKINHLIEGTINVYYGLGWFHSYNASNQLELYHTGSTCGFSNAVNFVPQKGFLVVCFSNIADNHAIEKPIRALLQKYNFDESEIDFIKTLELTR